MRGIEVPVASASGALGLVLPSPGRPVRFTSENGHSRQPEGSLGRVPTVPMVVDFGRALGAALSPPEADHLREPDHRRDVQAVSPVRNHLRSVVGSCATPDPVGRARRLRLARTCLARRAENASPVDLGGCLNAKRITSPPRLSERPPADAHGAHAACSSACLVCDTCVYVVATMTVNADAMKFLISACESCCSRRRPLASR